MDLYNSQKKKYGPTIPAFMKQSPKKKSPKKKSPIKKKSPKKVYKKKPTPKITNKILEQYKRGIIDLNKPCKVKKSKKNDAYSKADLVKLAQMQGIKAASKFSKAQLCDMLDEWAVKIL